MSVYQKKLKRNKLLFMKFIVNKSKCAGCGACLRACPYGAIKIGEDGKAFINQNKCKKCGKCQGICPFDAIKEVSEKLNEENIKQPKIQTPQVLTPFPSESLPIGEKKLGRGKGLGRGMRRELGMGPRDGRGGGRGGGGRRN